MSEKSSMLINLTHNLLGVVATNSSSLCEGSLVGLVRRHSSPSTRSERHSLATFSRLKISLPVHICYHKHSFEVQVEPKGANRLPLWPVAQRRLVRIFVGRNAAHDKTEMSFWDRVFGGGGPAGSVICASMQSNMILTFWQVYNFSKLKYHF